MNLSRFDPRGLALKGLRGNDDRYKYICHKDQQKPALCITVGVIAEDRSKELVRNGSGVGSRFVVAIPLTYEYERWVATVAMTLGGHCFRSQITDNKLVFSTRPETKSNPSRRKLFSSVTTLNLPLNNPGKRVNISSCHVNVTWLGSIP